MISLRFFSQVNSGENTGIRMYDTYEYDIQYSESFVNLAMFFFFLFIFCFFVLLYLAVMLKLDH